MNTKMQQTIIDTSKAYLNAIRGLRWFDLQDDHDNLIPLVHDLIDAGFNREEILEVAKRMGHDDADSIDMIVDPIAEDRPWMDWGRSLN